MGKHSNIIFCDENRMVLDSIKHVSSHMSSVREVLPGRQYFLPRTQEKSDPLTINEEEFISAVCKKPCNISRALYSSLTGLSPLIAEEICYRASIPGCFIEAIFALPICLRRSMQKLGAVRGLGLFL